MTVRIAIYGKAHVISPKSQTVGTMDVSIDKKSTNVLKLSNSLSLKIRNSGYYSFSTMG